MAGISKLQGCYRRVLIFVLVVMMLAFAVGIFLYQRLGGLEGTRYWMAGRALNGAEAHLLKKAPDGNWFRKPDGVSEGDVNSQFEKVREAIDDRRVDLIQLDRVLRTYHAKFQKTKLSTQEAIQFLNNIEAVIFSDESD